MEEFSINCTSNNVSVITSRNINWDGRVVRMWEMRVLYRVFVGKSGGTVSNCHT
jgi:hypothetical protein